MAIVSPQLEDGYTPIANEIIEALARFQFNGSQLRLILFLLRKTYGWHKKEDKISISQWVLGTGLSRRNVIRELKNLRKMNVILDNTKGLKKDYSAWSRVTSLSLPYIENIGDKSVMVTDQSLLGDKSVTLGVTDRPPTKDITTKDTNTITSNAAAQRVIEYFNIKCNKALKLNQSRSKLISKRLKDYTEQDILKAIDNFSHDDWPDRWKYCDLVYCIGIINSKDNLEKWLHYSDSCKTAF